jgi:hypothetical protein
MIAHVMPVLAMVWNRDMLRVWAMLVVWLLVVVLVGAVLVWVRIAPDRGLRRSDVRCGKGRGHTGTKKWHIILGKQRE